VWTRSDAAGRFRIRAPLSAISFALTLAACATPSPEIRSLPEIAPGAAVPEAIVPEIVSPTTPETVPGPSEANAVRERMVAAALAQVGRPYRYGGETTRGFDCSGLVRYAHGTVDIEVPRRTREQAASVRPVDPSRLEPGDLLFFRIDGNRPSHVSIYVGDGHFVHAPSSGGRVHLERLDHPYWAPRLLHAGHYFAE
jgi:cell wall-associated NlpC family hydrolase